MKIPGAKHADTTQERLTSIWSLAKRAEVPVRIYYRVVQTGKCRVLELDQVEDLRSDESILPPGTIPRQTASGSSALDLSSF